MDIKQTEWPLIELGYGLIEVGAGYHEDKQALIFGRNGTGKIGEETRPNRQCTNEETLAVVTFANVESLDVVLEKLCYIRARLESAEFVNSIETE